MSKEKKFDEYLVDFQLDLRKIIGAHRRPTHKKSLDEILSQVNLYLIKTKDYIIEKLGNEFSRQNFCKMAYTYARNHVSWQQSNALNSKHVKNVADHLHQTEDGPKTTFELVVEYQGEEDSGFEDFDHSDKFKQILKDIREYSSLLTKTQLLYMRFVEVGFNYREIASHFNVTHQAVSHEMRDAFSKVSQAFKINLNDEEDSHLISKGQQAMRDFFGTERERNFKKSDETPLIAFLLANPGKHSVGDVSKKFFNGKYHPTCVGSMCRHLRVAHLLKRPSHYSKKDISELIKLINKGASFETIAQKLNKSRRSVCAKFGQLKKDGYVGEYKYQSKYEKQRELAYKLINKGFSSEQIQEETGLAGKSIAGFRIALVRNQKQ